MNPRPKRRHIEELAGKLDFLARDPAAQKINGCSGVSDLGRRCGFTENLSTFKNLKSKANTDLISPDHERAIAKYCRFRLDWLEWVSGTAKAFGERYLREVLPAETSVSEKRRTNIPLSPRYTQQNARGRLASLKMEVVRSNSSEQWPIKIELYCRDDNGYGICHGLIDLHCRKAYALRSESAFHEPCEVPGSNASLRLGAGPEHKPSWSVKALSGILDRDVCPREAYCIVRGLSPGDKITATFSICVKDFPGTEECIRRVVDGKPVTGRNRKLFLERIGAALMAQSDASEVVLCSHEAIFEDAYAGMQVAELAEG